MKDLVSTYSIVARDPVTKEMGVAVQSHYFSVGPICPWAEAGVGAVATQSLVDPGYGPRGLALMRSGKSAPETLKALVAGDEQEAVRQVAMVDAQGGIAGHTGARCIAEAGHVTGKEFSVQANMMLKDSVWQAMAETFESSDGDLADRMMAALFAAEGEGGDIRGKQSAAILLVSGTGTGRVWADRLLDLRVEDHPEPLEELTRLIRMKRAYKSLEAAEATLEKGDLAGALHLFAATQDVMGDNVELVFWQAIGLAFSGHVEEAMPLFKTAFESNRNWAELLKRLPAAGLVPDDKDLVERILSSI